MVSAKTLFATGAALLATIASATPTVGKIHSIRDSDTPCGSEPVPGFLKPTNGTTITYTAEEQENYDGATFEIIYCSGQYYKTSSLNVKVLLGPTSGGEVLGSADPTVGAADDGFYGYIFNVTVYPEDGDYLTGPQQLSIFEYESGYYNAYNYELHTITIDLETAPTDSTR